MSAVSMLIERIRSEYLAMPGLKLTPAQARRLWPANEAVFDAAMTALVTEGFLTCLHGKAYVAMPRPHAAKADRRPQSSSLTLRCPHCRRLNAVRRERTVTGTNVATTLRCTVCGQVTTLAEIA